MIFIFRYLKAHVKHLNQTLLANLPKVQVTEQMKESICALCLENYQSEEDVTKLKCQHIYHLDCIKIWVVRSNCCPLCRKKVVYY
jgi:E3 ubiquitin-protein ligase synoviolin